jgi:hypothetical protein
MPQLHHSLLIHHSNIPGRLDILDGLVTKLEILLERDSVLNAEEDDRGGNDQRASNQAPL